MKDFLQGKWFKHPLHPILVSLPTALWPAALVFDILSHTVSDGNVMVRTSFCAILFGLLGALLAAPTGLADWWDIKREKPAWKLGIYHLGLNITTTVVWLVNLLLRLGPNFDAAEVQPLPLALSAVGTVLLIAATYLGGLMVYDQGISIARHSKKKWRGIAVAAHARVPEEKG